MPKNTEKLGLFEKDGEHYFLVRPGDSYIGHGRPCMERLKPTLYKVIDEGFETMKILREATVVYSKIQAGEEQRQKMSAEWEKIIAKYGNDNLLPPPATIPRTPGEKRKQVDNYYDGWQQKDSVWRKLSQAIANKRNSEKMLQPCQTYFWLKRNGEL